MKKIMSLLLAACMLLALIPAAFAAEEAGLPQIGEVLYGFTLKETRDFPMIGGEILLFEHEKTGAKFMYIANNDTNRAFDLTFFTRAIDDTGLPHVFEHATLSGSDRYPSASLFFNLIYQTYNTYLNAETGQLYTTYPTASLSEAQLLKYADFYTDSCLHPCILKDESIYREEAWRYRLPDAESDLTIEGTVYSEMLAAMNLSRTAHYNWNRAAFPGATVGNVSGGDPASIPDMTWEDLRAYHDKYYHPSNCVAYLYGQIEDYTAFLKLLDEAFAPYEKREFSFEEENYTPISAPVIQSLPYPVEASSETANGAMIYYAFICPGAKKDAKQDLLLNTLTDLMLADSSVLMQQLKKALPSGSFGTYIARDGPEDAIIFYAVNVNKEDASQFQETVDAALAVIAEEGFPQDLVDGIMSTLSLDNKLSREETELGVKLITERLAPTYAATGNLFDYLDYAEGMQQMDEWNQKGLYQETVSSWLLENETTVLVTTYPEPGLREELDAAEAERLAAIKASMTTEELQAVIKETNAEKAEDDASAYITELQAVTVSSLPEEKRKYVIRDETGSDGVRRLTAEAAVDGVGQTLLLLDATGIRQEDLHWFALYLKLLGEMDTAKHTREELPALISRYLYNFNTRLSVPHIYGTKTFHPYLHAGWIAQEEDIGTGYDLVYELLYETQFTDTETLAGLIAREKATLKQNITQSPYTAMLYRMLGAEQPLYAYYDCFNFLPYYQFLTEAERQIAEDPDGVISKLQEIRNVFHNRTNAILAFAGDPAVFETNAAASGAFFAKLDAEHAEPVEYVFERPAMSEALIVDSAVQYNAVVGDFEALGLEKYTADLDAVASLLSDVFLIPMLRETYGVYSPLHYFMEDVGTYLLTYRDPNIGETFDVYAALPELLAGLDQELGQDFLDGYILSAYSRLAMPEGELSGAISAITSVICEEPEDLAIRHMEELKALTPEGVAAYAEAYANLMKNGRIFTAGGAAAINENAAMYENILSPFAAAEETAETDQAA